ncbi:hypothetical protein EB105725_73_00010, partial [Shimwellia blattae DSM 4481 = NBRC 105725]
MDITAHSGRTNITVDYHQTNQKIDTGKTLTRWPVFVDHYSTSQQQIQRIETGKVAAKLGLAQEICAALKKPLSAVFPDSANLLQKLRNQSSRSSDELKDIATSGIEMDCCFWTVKLWLRGQQNYLLLPISPADKRRFFSYFQERSAADYEHFFVFDSEQW